MKPADSFSKTTPTSGTITSKERGLLAAKKMARELRAEHRRWKMPLLTWKDGKVVAVKVK
ncbi:hypothetical protein OJ996_18640 [Luteolibacter sp. GHJ8]|uniref:Uncharacterized protein n=1 Tax=Luteolibacter rhizosphaerae TaxID=2989719 RepID=A0ABT3G6Z1_9BACT|nr:hypothetical protein [Luteolibacter rhizosphaerae]MCW1915610.1 hypothetical protein [Luteolibacter rhizosphaerae]